MAIVINDRRRPAAVGLAPEEDIAMANPDTVMVRPLSTYFDQGEYRQAGGEPYRVTRSHGEELRGLGTAEVLAEAPAEDPLVADAVSTVAVAATEMAETTEDADRPRGGRGGRGGAKRG